MGHFERHLRELGTKVDSFLDFARSGTVEELATELASWDTWYDISPYGDDRVPFFKRAQIAAADLALSGLAAPDGLDRLTLFADNLVPHVLRHRRRARVRRRPRPADRQRNPDRARLARGGRDPRHRAARGRAARPSARRTRPRPPSTTCSGTAAASRATRHAPATVPAPPPTDLVRIEGFHALKHALRFGAEIVEVTRGPRRRRERLAEQLAPDLTLPEMGPGDEIVAFAKRPRVRPRASARPARAR